MLNPPKILSVAEDTLEEAIALAGGRRAHPGADRRQNVGADFLIDDAVVELKILDEDGLDKVERQEKLAELFSQLQPGRPVVVIDPGLLPPEKLRTYKAIMQGPIKSGVAHAKKQLRQSRQEHPGATCSVLMVVNNRFTALTHEELLPLVAERVRNDTSQIDAVVVAGCYLHGDGFDTYALWPIDVVAIHPERPFAGYERLRAAWNEVAEKIMTEAVTTGSGWKTPEEDKIFERNGITFIRPARPIGGPSKYHLHGRPRKNSSGITACPPVAITFPGLSRTEWRRLAAIIAEPGIFDSFDNWVSYQAQAKAAHTPLRPFVAPSVSRGSFEAWRRRSRTAPSLAALMVHANAVFDREARRVMDAAQEHDPGDEVPRRFILVVTDEIGQDRANDVSRMALIECFPRREPLATDLIGEMRMFHEHALALGAAYAVRCGTEHVLWRRQRRHVWH